MQTFKLFLKQFQNYAFGYNNFISHCSFVLTYWIPKSILIQCDLDNADVFNQWRAEA